MNLSVVVYLSDTWQCSGLISGSLLRSLLAGLRDRHIVPGIWTLISQLQSKCLPCCLTASAFFVFMSLAVWDHLNVKSFVLPGAMPSRATVWFWIVCFVCVYTIESFVFSPFCRANHAWNMTHLGISVGSGLLHASCSQIPAAWWPHCSNSSYLNLRPAKPWPLLSLLCSHVLWFLTGCLHAEPTVFCTWNPLVCSTHSCLRGTQMGPKFRVMVRWESRSWGFLLWKVRRFKDFFWRAGGYQSRDTHDDLIWEPDLQVCPS